MEEEARARLKINRLLEEAGWRFFASAEGRATVTVEGNVKLNDLGDDFERTKNGFVDHLLLDENGFPLAVLEAKSVGRGANIKNLTQGILDEFKVPLPSLSVQRQIVARIEEEQQLVQANRRLIELFEAKIRDRIREVWGE